MCDGPSSCKHQRPPGRTTAFVFDITSHHCSDTCANSPASSGTHGYHLASTQPPLSNGDKENGVWGHHRRKVDGSLWAAKEITARIESASNILRSHSMRLVARRNTTGLAYDTPKPLIVSHTREAQQEWNTFANRNRKATGSVMTLPESQLPRHLRGSRQLVGKPVSASPHRNHTCTRG